MISNRETVTTRCRRASVNLTRLIPSHQRTGIGTRPSVPGAAATGDCPTAGRQISGEFDRRPLIADKAVLFWLNRTLAMSASSCRRRLGESQIVAWVGATCAGCAPPVSCLGEFHLSAQRHHLNAQRRLTRLCWGASAKRVQAEAEVSESCHPSRHQRPKADDVFDMAGHNQIRHTCVGGTIDGYSQDAWSDRHSSPIEYVFSLVNAPHSPGMYVISAGRPINRAVGVDEHGILTIGESDLIHRRLMAFAGCVLAPGSEGHIAGYRYALLEFT